MNWTTLIMLFVLHAATEPLKGHGGGINIGWQDKSFVFHRGILRSAFSGSYSLKKYSQCFYGLLIK